MKKRPTAYRFSPYHRIVIGVFVILSLLAGSSQSISALARPASRMAPRAYLPLAVNGASGGTGPAEEVWLAYLNQYRALALLPPLAVNKDWGQGGWYHSRYMVKNDQVGHSEDPANEWYTPEGDQAGQSGNLVGSSNQNATDLFAIDAWMQAPFHAVGILDPALQRVGFGSFRAQEGGLQMGATLDVLRGLGDVPARLLFPVVWPADGTVVPIGSHWGESPNPLSSCPGYTAPSGLPIILQIGAGELTPSVSRHNFKTGTTLLEHCVFDETSYTNPDSAAQSQGRAILASRDAIVLIPRQPLTPGKSYTVSITVNGQNYVWSFRVANTSQQAAAPEEMFFPGTLVR